jgi:hypothetical protein
MCQGSNGDLAGHAWLHQTLRGRIRYTSLWAGCSKRPSNEAAGESKPEAYPLGYVEDFDEPRTKLGAFFSSRLHVEAEIDNIGFFNNVVFAFEPEQPLLFYLRL